MKQTCGNYLFALIFLVFGVTVSAQTSDKLWNKKNAFEFNSNARIERRTIPKEFEVYNLDINSLKYQLKNIPKRKGKSLHSTTVLNFPSVNGELEKYEIFEASILEKPLQEKFPSIKSYIGKSINNPGKTIRFSVSNIGLHAMVMGSENGTMYIDPYTKNKESYIFYAKKNLPSIEPFECHVEEIAEASKESLALKSQNANDGKLRTFRLAIATTGEYSQFQLIYYGIATSATEAEKKAAVMAAINATMTRVNGIFERDVALTMELVSNNDNLIFFDPLTDGFTNDDGAELINESQEKIDDIIGDANYDIGHTFSTGGGGLAQLRSPCRTGAKASGITGSSYPIGDTYDVDYVAHEMGHQYGANHTFNSEEGTCGGNNRNDETAIEPGSGSTIMAYAGLCAPDNVQGQGDDYFHLVSIREMWANISLGSSTCAVTSTINNAPPSVDELVSYTLPISTPFVLEATATDSDVNDVLTYTWEQLDNEEAVAPPVSTSTVGPSFRSIEPTISPKRYFPNQDKVIAGSLFSDWEVLTSVSRTMKFGVNVRDNNINGGQSASKETTLTFDESAGPFSVSSQASSETWNASEIKTINWDVANTNVAPVNCLNVNILLSIDGGFTYPITLASNVTNNGLYNITVPNITTDKARVKIESTNNIFYAINNANIIIEAKEFTMAFSSDTLRVCKPDNAIASFTYSTALGFDEETTFTASGIPSGASVAFSPATAAANNTAVEMTISGISAVDLGSYNITVTGTSGTTSMVKNQLVVLEVYNNTLVVPSLLLPTDISEIVKPYNLEWETDSNSLEYIVQISKSSDFSSITEEALVETNLFSPENLEIDTLYYWRVKAKNNCGESEFSTVFSFTTANESCDSFVSTDTPKSIPDNDSNGVNSIINVNTPKEITKVIVQVSITHPYVKDLALTLISPEGIRVLLSVNNGGDGNNYTNTVFDDDADVNIGNASPPFTGTFVPEIPLAYLNGINSSGNWVLNVVDSGEADIGTINNWNIQICGIPKVIVDDDDNDGVVNSIDQCPNTTAGAEVDELGCFLLPSDNFTIQAVGETCGGKGNGQILISSKNATYNYSTIINGQTYNFSNSQVVNELPAGDYNFCISIDGETYTQCYDVTIEEGIQLEASAKISGNKVTVEIEQGTAPFTVLVNGEELFTTSKSTFEVDILQGDLLALKSAVECEGMFAKKIDLFNEIIAYPNPTNGSFFIDLPIIEKEIIIELYNMQSQLVSSKLYTVKAGKVQLNIENESTGIYIAKVLLDSPIALKIIKQ